MSRNPHRSVPDHGRHFVPGGEAAPDLAPQPLDHFKRGYRERADQRDRETEFLNGDFYGSRQVTSRRPPDNPDDRRVGYQGGRGGDNGGGFHNGGDRRGSMDGGDGGRSQIIMGLDVQGLVDRLYRRDADVFQELDMARSEYSSVFNSGKAVTAIISNLARRRNLHLANAVWNWVDQVGIPKNTFHYNSMISCCEKVRDYKKAIQLMDEMRHKNVTKNEVTFSSAISACEKCGQWRTALDLLEQMKREGAGQTAIAYNAAISACEKGLVPHKALEIFEQMKREGIKPTVVTYSALISAAEKGQQWKLALEVLDEMKAEGHGANVIAYSAAISACSKGQMWQKALELFREIEAMGGKPSIVTYNATMTALEKGLQWERALDLFDEMKTKNMPVTVVSYGSAISACEKGLQYRQCLEFLDEMTEMGIKKNVIIFGAAMSCMEKSCRADIAFQLMDRMKFEGVVPNVHIYNSAISACARCNLWEKGYELFQEMEHVGVKRDVVTYNAVLDAVCTQVQLGRRLFKEGVELGFYSRVSRLGTQWLELDLHFLSLGGGEIALGWWFEECLVAYLINTSKLEAVQSISIVTGYGKTRTRGSRLNDDGMRLRVRAMLNYMNIKETPQPNKGRIHIDKSELVNEVTRNGGKIVFDIGGYSKFKAEETTANMYPDVPQILRPRFRPAAPGEGPQGTFIREGALVEPQPPLTAAQKHEVPADRPDRRRPPIGGGNDGSGEYGGRRASERDNYDGRRGSHFDDRRGNANDWDRDHPNGRVHGDYQEQRPNYNGQFGSHHGNSDARNHHDEVAPTVRRGPQREWDDNRGGVPDREWHQNHHQRSYDDYEDDRGRRVHQRDSYNDRIGSDRAYDGRNLSGDYNNGDRRHADHDTVAYRSEGQGFDPRYARDVRAPKRARHGLEQHGEAAVGFDDYPRQTRASDSDMYSNRRGGGEMSQDARHHMPSIKEEHDAYGRGLPDPLDRHKKRPYDEDVKPAANRGYNIEPTYSRKR